MLTSYGWEDLYDEGEGCISIDLMNIGMGPALDIVIEARYPEVPDHGPSADPPPKEQPGPGLVRVLLPGERTRFGLPVSFEGPRPDWPPAAYVEIRGTFAGPSRTQRYNLDGDEVPDTERLVWTDASRTGFVTVTLPQQEI